MEGHVVADVSDIDNEPLLKIVGGGIFETLVSHDIIGRIIVMCGRSPGLAKGTYILDVCPIQGFDN